LDWATSGAANATATSEEAASATAMKRRCILPSLSAELRSDNDSSVVGASKFSAGWQ
jgi:hypothetical protein